MKRISFKKLFEKAHPRLFKKVADHMLSLDNLHLFNQLDYSGIIWAFAAVNVNHRQLVEAVAARVDAHIDLSSFDVDSSINFIGVYMKAEESTKKRDGVNIEKAPSED